MKTFTTSVLFAVAGLCGCSGVVSDDPTASEFGVYEDALMSAAGVASCETPKKVLVCHRPPGNPGNAHTICIGAPAAAPHLKHHPDALGACGPSASSDGGVDGHGGGGTGSPGGDGGDLEIDEGGNGGRGHSRPDAGTGAGGGGGAATDPETGPDAGVLG